ncbi:MAG: STAS domain-containing protein, partial [Actinobacteria bacterium]|nr:STAS domain-containing protein [Actinomycetota bacterium]
SRDRGDHAARHDGQSRGAVSGLGLDVTRHEGVVVVRLSGEVDLENTLELDEALQAALRGNDLGMVLDLSEVRYIDSGGIRVLFKIARTLSEEHRGLALVVPEASPLRRLLKVTRFEAAAPLCGSVPMALEAVKLQTEA